MKNNNNLGTLLSVETYSNLNCSNLNLNKNTFRQNILSENAIAPTAHFSPSGLKPTTEKEPIEDLEGNNVVGSTTNKKVYKKGFRRLDPNEKYDIIALQVSKLRLEGRYKRAKVYVSLKEENDKDFSIFLAGAFTSSKHELYRGCTQSNIVKEVIDAYFDTFPDCMVARLHYKSINGYITDFHRKNTKNMLISMHMEDNIYIATVFLYNEYIRIPLDNELTPSMKKYYDYYGIYKPEIILEHDDE